MRQPPTDLQLSSIVETLEREWALTAEAVTFLPLGHDSSAWAFRADATDGSQYFVKARYALISEAGLVVPRALRSAGITSVIAPLPTLAGELSAPCGRYVLIVYPFVDGDTGLHSGMSHDQWVALGAALRRVHETKPAREVERRLDRESFVPDAAALVRAMDAHVAANVPADGIARVLAERWRARRDTTLQLLRTAERLGGDLRRRSPGLVICHADIHTNNVIVDRASEIHIVDWDGAILAPPERDLMFVIGGLGPDFVRAHEEAWFLEGYGSVAVDASALAYYRYAWAIGDIASYAETALVRFDLSEIDRSEAVDRFESTFAPGCIAERALSSCVT